MDSEYAGKRVVVAGGGGAGMGAAVVRVLQAQDADVHVLDLREPPIAVTSFATVDLRDPTAIDDAIDAIPGPIDALFNCAGVPGGRLSDVEVMTINFAAARHLAARVASKMNDGGAIVTIASSGGMAWRENTETWLPLVATNGFAAAREWCATHPAEIRGGYVPSKQALIVWTRYAAVQLASRGIRVNCTSPGPTATPMHPDPQPMLASLTIPLGRTSTTAEQAQPLLFLNSAAATTITGTNLETDGGMSLAQWATKVFEGSADE